jgi:hypothetical protein
MTLRRGATEEYRYIHRVEDVDIKRKGERRRSLVGLLDRKYERGTKVRSGVERRAVWWVEGSTVHDRLDRTGLKSLQTLSGVDEHIREIRTSASIATCL